MSQHRQIEITCPKCRHTQSFTIWESLNATIDPGKKTELLRGELTQFTCSRCRASSEVAYPMLYHSMDRRFMVYCGAEGTVPDLSALPFGKLLKNYRLRVVPTRMALVEKIQLFDADIDDLAMELFKISMRAQMNEGAAEEMYFNSSGKSNTGQPALHFVLLAGQAWETITVARESYDEFATGVALLLGQEPAPPGEWLRINREYAAQLVRKYLPGATA